MSYYIPDNLVEDLIKILRNGVCQDQYDEIEVYETEQLMCKAADRIEELEAKLAKAVAGRDEALNQLDSARQSVDVLEKRVANLLCGYDEHRKPFVTFRTTLAELKGQDDE